MHLDDPSKAKIPRSPFRRRTSCVCEEAPAEAVVATMWLEVDGIATDSEIEAVS
jgi:hypothetical protein